MGLMTGNMVNMNIKRQFPCCLLSHILFKLKLTLGFYNYFFEIQENYAVKHRNLCESFIVRFNN